jgi:hypothetical protein
MHGKRKKYFKQSGVARTWLESRRSQPEGSGLVEARTSQGDPPSGAKAAEAEGLRKE